MSDNRDPNKIYKADFILYFPTRMAVDHKLAILAIACDTFDLNETSKIDISMNLGAGKSMQIDDVPLSADPKVGHCMRFTTENRDAIAPLELPCVDFSEELNRLTNRVDRLLRKIDPGERSGTPIVVPLENLRKECEST